MHRKKKKKRGRKRGRGKRGMQTVPICTQRSCAINGSLAPLEEVSLPSYKCICFTRRFFLYLSKSFRFFT